MSAKAGDIRTNDERGVRMSFDDFAEKMLRYDAVRVAEERRRLAEFQSTIEPKYCVNDTDVVYNSYNNKTSVIGTLINCIRKVQDVMITPTYDLGGHALNVSVSVTMNHLVYVDELTSLVTMDFFAVYSWFDHRLNMPALWTNSEEGIYDYGVDITQASTIENIQGARPLIWLPDIIYPDATAQENNPYYIRLFPEGYVMNLIHYRMTIAQPEFNYEQYPCDSHHIKIRFFSFTLNTRQLNLVPSYYGLLDFSETPDSQTEFFGMNPLWKLGDASAKLLNWRLNTGYSYRSSYEADIEIARRPNGIIIRLALPILMLALLGGLNFWADRNVRASMTTILLLALSALYLIIVGTIPKVGYTTYFDVFTLAMFFFLVFCCLLHYGVYALQVGNKLEKWPMRKLYIRLIESFGRLTAIPIILSFFSDNFSLAISRSAYAAMFTLLGLFFPYILFREYFGVSKVFRGVVDAVDAKCRSKKNLSMPELLFFNVFKRGKFTFDSVTLNQQEDSTAEIELKDKV
jgi:hypothetical protein